MTVNRRNFLKTAALAAVATGLPDLGRAATPKASAGKVSFALFSDIHYHPGTWPHGRDWLERILEKAAADKADFIIHAGDFVHDAGKAADYVRYYTGFRVKTYGCLGNHDGEYGGLAKTLAAYEMEKDYYFFDRQGWRFIVANPHYFQRKTGEIVPHENFNMYRCKDVKFPYILPPVELEWLKDTIENSPYPCVYIAHESVERPWSTCNGAEVRKIFDDANARHPGRVRLVINGHHHVDYMRVIRNIVYFDVNSASYYYSIKPHDCFPPEFVKTCVGAKQMIAWNDPLSCLVTLDVAKGTIHVEGTESTCYLGVTPEKAGIKLRDPHGRAIVPCIRGFDYQNAYS